MKKRVVMLWSVLVLAVALVVCGCSSHGRSDSTDDDYRAARTGRVQYHGWVPGAVEYCQKHDDKDGILIEVTGLITEGSHGDSVSRLTLVDPMSVYDSDDSESLIGKDIEVKPGDMCAEVYYETPVDAVPWPHLTTVRGIARLDPTQENKIIVRGAFDVS